jgi:hypothetical protein
MLTGRGFDSRNCHKLLNIMKPLHLIAGKDPTRPMMGYLQIRNGFVYVTNAWAAIKIPTCEVFGDGVIADSEELYIDAEQWAASKLHSETVIMRTYNTLRGVKSKLSVQMLTAEEFIEAAQGRYPDVETVLPAEDKPLGAVEFIGLNPMLLADVYKALKFDTKKFSERICLGFEAGDRAIRITHPDMIAGTRVVLMPMVFDEYVTPLQPTPVEDNIDDLL